ncbi:MAG: hypothetical protein EON95_04045 [Caulobacteraceae bacterium]|nr:MAG: hypothetical protein EON95_04045 [Caulobacteraceae bacterium]
MYELRVFLPGENQPLRALTFSTALQVMDVMPLLLSEHAGCERISVSAAGSYLFSVDCKGDPIERDKP